MHYMRAKKLLLLHLFHYADSMSGNPLSAARKAELFLGRGFHAYVVDIGIAGFGDILTHTADIPCKLRRLTQYY